MKCSLLTSGESLSCAAVVSPTLLDDKVVTGIYILGNRGLAKGHRVGTKPGASLLTAIRMANNHEPLLEDGCWKLPSSQYGCQDESWSRRVSETDDCNLVELGGLLSFRKSKETVSPDDAMSGFR